MSIDYEKVDYEIKQIVKHLNEIEGIKTLMSCSGHKGKQIKGYISMHIENMNTLSKLVDKLKDVINTVDYDYEDRILGRISLEVKTSDYYKNNHKDKNIFILIFEHKSRAEQEKLINKIEKALWRD